MITWVERCWPVIRHIRPRTRHAVVMAPATTIIRRVRPRVRHVAPAATKIAVGGLVCQMVPFVTGGNAAYAPTIPPAIIPSTQAPDYVPPFDLTALSPSFGSFEGGAPGGGSIYGSSIPTGLNPAGFVAGAQHPAPAAMVPSLFPVESIGFPESAALVAQPVTVIEPSSILIFATALVFLIALSKRSA